MTEEVPIDKLFNFNRFHGGLSLFLLLLYFPIGFCLAVIRFFIGLHIYLIACVLPKRSLLRRFVMRCMCAVVGIVVVQEDCNYFDEECKVLVANYTTKLDYVPLQLVVPHLMVSIWNFPELVTKLLGYHDLGAQFGRETLIANAKKHTESDSNLPLLSFPEGGTTSGTLGLLKFSVWPFSLDEPVQPVTIKIERPLFHVAPSLADSKLAIDWFWLLFVPVTVFRISYLPVQTIADDEEASEFAKRVQKLMARKLGVRGTNHTCSDKFELLKKLFSDKKYLANDPKFKRSSMQCKVEQVKAVLPHISDSIIKEHLAMTKDVDLTIANILEGKTASNQNVGSVERNSSVQETLKSSHKSSSSPPTSLSPKKSVHSSSTFGKTSNERHLSFQERKRIMIDQAKEKYLEKFKSSQ